MTDSPEIALAVACPICGAVPGRRCELVRGGFRNTSHRDRRLNAAEAVKREAFPPGHISDHDLERYHLDMIADEAELAPLEEHLLLCGMCRDRAVEAADWVDAIRATANGRARAAGR